MTDSAMSPHRALTIAIKKTIDNDVASGVPWPIAGGKTAAARAAALLASRILINLPDGWGLVDKSEIDELNQHVREIEGTTKILLAFKIEQDGHAKNLGAALKIAGDRAAVHELYPEIPE